MINVCILLLTRRRVTSTVLRVFEDRARKLYSVSESFNVNACDMINTHPVARPHSASCIHLSASRTGGTSSLRPYSV